MDESTMRATIAAWLDAFNRRDWAAYSAHFHPAVEYIVPGRPPLLGREAHVAQDQRNATGTLAATRIVPHPAAQAAAVEGVFEIPGVRRSEWVSMLDFREGLIVRERLYYDRKRDG
jgi:ketosteroid isomerase-like protein